MCIGSNDALYFVFFFICPHLICIWMYQMKPSLKGLTLELAAM